MNVTPPHPKPAARRRQANRIIDPRAIRRAKDRWPLCAACGRWAAHDSGHHVLPKDHGHPGDDVEANIVTLCGSGTSLCHGATHGSPYVAIRASEQAVHERRDAEWVNRRIGRTLAASRPDTIAYLFEKLGERGARNFLYRAYYLRVDADQQPAGEVP